MSQSFRPHKFPCPHRRDQSERLIRYGANFKVVGKTEPQCLSFPGAWQTVAGTLADLVKHINQGRPWMPALLGGNRKRWQCNANHAELLALDIDGGMTYQQARDNFYLSNYASICIPTASATPSCLKFRPIFVLPEMIGHDTEGNCILLSRKADGKDPYRFRHLKTWQVIRICNRYLAEVVGSADPACKDAARFFFGATGKQPFRFNPQATLPQNFIDAAIAWQEAQEAQARRKVELARQQWERWRGRHSEHDVEALIVRALDCIEPDCAYNDWIAIGMALAGMGEAWFPVWDNWSAGGAKYKPQQMGQKWKSFRGKPASPGTILGIAKRYGFGLSYQ